MQLRDRRRRSCVVLASCGSTFTLSLLTTLLEVPPRGAEVTTSREDFHLATTEDNNLAVDTVEKVLTDNRPCYRLRLFDQPPKTSNTASFGKVESLQPHPQSRMGLRQHLGLIGSTYPRHNQWLHTYNHHRRHTAVCGPPITRVKNLPGRYSQQVLIDAMAAQHRCRRTTARERERQSHDVHLPRFGLRRAASHPGRRPPWNLPSTTPRFCGAGADHDAHVAPLGSYDGIDKQAPTDGRTRDPGRAQDP